MEVSSAVATQSTMEAIMKDYNVKLGQLVEGIVNRDKALEGLNLKMEHSKAENDKLSLTVAALKTRYPDDVAFVVVDTETGGDE